MSIFSSDYEYYGFSTTQPLIPDDSKADTLSTFLLSALKHDEENIAGNLVAANAAGLPNLVRQYYRYGRDHYYWGLPTSNFKSIDVSLNAINDVLGEDFEAIWVKYSLSEQEYNLIQEILDLSWFDYDLIEAQVPVLPGGPTYYVNPLSFTYYHDNSGNYTVLWKIVTKDYSSGPAPYQDPSEWPQDDDYYSVDISVSGSYAVEQDYFWVIYVDADELASDPPDGWDSNTHWPLRSDTFYRYHSTDFPENSVADTASPFLPIAVFTRGTENYWSIPEWSNTLHKLLKTLNIDATEFAEEFQSSLQANVPDGFVEHDLFVGFMINLHKEASIGTGLAEYKFEFIKALHLQSVTTRSSFDSYYTAYQQWEIDYQEWQDEVNDNIGGAVGIPPQLPPVPGNTVEVTEAGESGFYYQLQWTFIERYESTISHADAHSQFSDLDWGGSGMAPGLPLSFADVGWVDGFEYAPDGNRLYVSYYVNAASSLYKILTPDGFKSAKADDGVWCPINYSILKQLNFKNQEEVLQDGLCAILFVLVEEEIEWYQQSFWQGIILMATIAVVMYIGVVGYQGVLAALGLGAVEGSVALTISLWILKFAVGALVSVATSIVGIDSPVIQMLISTVVAGGLDVGFENFFSNIWQNLASPVLNIFSGDIIKIFSSIMSLSSFKSSIEAQRDLDALEELQEETLLTEAERQERLEEAYTGLDRGISNPHLELSKRLKTEFYETPDEFYSRTMELNPGEKIMQIPANFVDLTMYLPMGINNTPLIKLHRG